MPAGLGHYIASLRQDQNLCHTTLGMNHILPNGKMMSRRLKTRIEYVAFAVVSMILSFALSGCTSAQISESGCVGNKHYLHKTQSSQGHPVIHGKIVDIFPLYRSVFLEIK